MNYSNMSINSSVQSLDSPPATVENNVVAFQDIPLTALGKRTLRMLSNLLNSKKMLRSEEGYERDWRGLARLAKQTSLCDESSITGDDPMIKVISLWCRNNPKTATFSYLEHFLEIIDRADVSDDIYENLVEDTKMYKMKQKQCFNFNSDDNVDISPTNLCSSDSNILTTSDVIRAQKGLPPQIYDAFILYADADLNYASEMLTKLEDNPEYNFKLCLKDRDLLAGVQFEHVALTQLIEERCKHLIVILTQEFLKSPENNFLVNYTQALQIKHKTIKILPLLYEESVDIPRTLKMYIHLRYNTGTSSLVNFWSKLAYTLKSMSTEVTAASGSLYKNNIAGKLSTNKQISITSDCHLNSLPSPVSEIPSISIIPPDDNEIPRKKERSKPKHSTMRIDKSKTQQLNDGIVLRNAHSTGQLNTSYENKNITRMLSTDSICSESKKKKKFPSKIFKKIFSRSSSKLQEA